MNLHWRDLESALSCLRAMADVSARLLADRKTSNITIFIVDPWLRKAVTFGHSKTEQLTIFYLGQGKTELQALVRLEESKVCPPAFTDLQALPFRSKTCAALPVLTPNRSRVWAVLQVMLEETKMAESEANFVPRILQDAGVSQEINLPSQCFTDLQVNYLQLLCSFMGGVLLHIERLDNRAKIVDRTKSIMEGAIDVNKAKTLADFEQRVKHLFSSFFSVSTIRVLFFDPDNRSLLISSSQMRKKGTTSINMTKGILGQCAHKQQVINIPDIHQNPFVDPIADGLQRKGRPVGKHAAMLVGPVLVESSERSGQELLGVVQLLEKKRRAADGSTQPSEFLPDEQHLFNVTWESNCLFERVLYDIHVYLIQHQVTVICPRESKGFITTCASKTGTRRFTVEACSRQETPSCHYKFRTALFKFRYAVLVSGLVLISLAFPLKCCQISRATHFVKKWVTYRDSGFPWRGQPMDLQHPATLNPFKSIALSFQFVRRLFHLHSAPACCLIGN